MEEKDWQTLADLEDLQCTFEHYEAVCREKQNKEAARLESDLKRTRTVIERQIDETEEHQTDRED